MPVTRGSDTSNRIADETTSRIASATRRLRWDGMVMDLAGIRGRRVGSIRVRSRSARARTSARGWAATASATRSRTSRASRRVAATAATPRTLSEGWSERSTSATETLKWRWIFSRIARTVRRLARGPSTIRTSSRSIARNIGPPSARGDGRAGRGRAGGGRPRAPGPARPAQSVRRMTSIR